MTKVSRIISLSLITAFVFLFAPIRIYAESGNTTSPAPAKICTAAAYKLDANGHLSLNLAEKDIKSPAEETADGYVVFDFSGVTGITGVTAKLDPEWFAESGKGLILNIDAVGGISVSNAAWKEILNTAASGIAILTLEKGTLTVSITQNGKAVDWVASKNPIVLSIPYDGGDDLQYGVIYKNNGAEEPKHLIPRSFFDNGFVYALAFSTGEYGMQYMGKTGFSDTEGQWMDCAANYLAARNVMTGEKQGVFDPERHITRAEFTVMLMNMFDVKLNGTLISKPFADQKDIPGWAVGAVLKGADMEILAADKNGNFNPNDDITRQDMFTLTYNLMNKLGIINPSEGGMALREFSDSDKIAEYAYIPLLTLLQNGLINGSANEINPTAPASKAEAAQFMYNVLQYDVTKTNESFVKPLPSGKQIASSAGDATGDGIPDDVFLRGTKTSAIPFIQDITLSVCDGKTGKITDVTLKNNAGYEPTLFLGDFSGDGADDILISVESGGSGAYTYDYIYSFANGVPAALFSSDSYNETYEYGVSFKDGCKVDVYSCSNNAGYTVDIGYRDRDYLNQIYDSRNKLVKKVEGFVNPLSSLLPVDIDRDGVYELLAFQRVTGLCNADSLGYVENFLKWENGKFVLLDQYVGISGIRDNNSSS